MILVYEKCSILKIGSPKIKNEERHTYSTTWFFVRDFEGHLLKRHAKNHWFAEFLVLFCGARHVPIYVREKCFCCPAACFLWFLFAWDENMSKQRHHCLGVSKNSGTPKWMVYNGNPYKKDDLGVPLFSETPIFVFGSLGILWETKNNWMTWDGKHPTARWAATSYIWGWGSPISCIIIPCFFHPIKITGILWYFPTWDPWNKHIKPPDSGFIGLGWFGIFGSTLPEVLWPVLMCKMRSIKIPWWHHHRGTPSGPVFGGHTKWSHLMATRNPAKKTVEVEVGSLCHYYKGFRNIPGGCSGFLYINTSIWHVPFP